MTGNRIYLRLIPRFKLLIVQSPEEIILELEFQSFLGCEVLVVSDYERVEGIPDCVKYHDGTACCNSNRYIFVDVLENSKLDYYILDWELCGPSLNDPLELCVITWKRVCFANANESIRAVTTYDSAFFLCKRKYRICKFLKE